MKIIDEGFFLYSSRFGESSKILYIFSKENGLVKGLTKITKKNCINFMNLDKVLFTWSSRDKNGLGYLKCEQKNSTFLDHYLFSIVKASASELCLRFLPLWEKNTAIYEDVLKLSSLNNRDSSFLIGRYLNWEINLLKHLGYGFNLEYCYVSGEKNNTHFISPKTGNAVSYKVGKKLAHKLFKIPLCMKEGFKKTHYEDYLDAMKINLFFLKKILDNENLKFIYRDQITKFYNSSSN